MKEWASALWVDERGMLGVHDGNDRLMTVRTQFGEDDALVIAFSGDHRPTDNEPTFDPFGGRAA